MLDRFRETLSSVGPQSRSTIGRGRGFGLSKTWKRFTVSFEPGNALKRAVFTRKPTRARWPRRSRRGATVTEFGLALALTAVALTAFLNFTRDLERTRAADLDARALTDMAFAGRNYVLSQRNPLAVGATYTLTATDLEEFGFFGASSQTQSATGRILSAALLKRSDNETIILSYAKLPAGETGLQIEPRAGAGIARVGTVYEDAPDFLRGPVLNYDMSWMNASFSSAKPQVGDLVAIDVVRGDQSMTPYLHRTLQTASPELNQMQTSLDMGGNDLRNVGTLAAETVEVAKGLTAGTLDGLTDVSGSLSAESLSLSGALTVQGDATFNDTIEAPGVAISGNLSTENLSATTMEIAGSASIATMSVTDTLTTNVLAADQMSATEFASEDATMRHLTSDALSTRTFTSTATGAFESLTTGSCTGC